MLSGNESSKLQGLEKIAISQHALLVTIWTTDWKLIQINTKNKPHLRGRLWGFYPAPIYPGQVCWAHGCLLNDAAIQFHEERHIITWKLPSATTAFRCQLLGATQYQTTDRSCHRDAPQSLLEVKCIIQGHSCGIFWGWRPSLATLNFKVLCFGLTLDKWIKHDWTSQQVHPKSYISDSTGLS